MKPEKNLKVTQNSCFLKKIGSALIKTEHSMRKCCSSSTAPEEDKIVTMGTSGKWLKRNWNFLFHVPLASSSFLEELVRWFVRPPPYVVEGYLEDKTLV